MNETALAAAPDRPPHLTPGFRLARIVSWLGHPLVFLSLSVGILVVMRLPNRVGVIVLLTLLLSVVLPTAFLLFRGVRSGEWSDADVSVRKQRNRFYPKAIPFSALSVVLFWLLNAPWFVVRGAIVICLLLVVAGIANWRIKLSLHALFAFFCATILFHGGLVLGGGALGLALLVFWSRLYLKRHEFDEMVVGTLLGIIGGIAAVWWP